ncbi:MAG TPA: translation initiation factor IF-2 [Methylomirabilota bacterium]|jgi:translation initiation factor IF-2|nr:translation initiation factor IF-2 [Methylomirabilota bacterium]
MPVRIYDISKKLGLENKEVLSKAKELGIAAARVASSSLDKITAEYLEQQLLLAHPNLSAPPAPPPAPPQIAEPIVLVTAPPPPPPPQEETVREEEEPVAAVATSVMEPEAPAEPEPATLHETVETETPAEPLPVAKAPVPPPLPAGPKVGDKVGFIQLPSRPGPKPAEKPGSAKLPARPVETRPTDFGKRGDIRTVRPPGAPGGGARPGVPGARPSAPAKAPARLEPPGPPKIVLPADAQVITIKPPIVVRELAEQLKQKPFKIIADLMELGVFANVNQAIDEGIAQKVCAKYRFRFEVEKRERGSGLVHAPIKKVELDVEDKPEELVARAPVVTIMGHVDHGKTTLLDVIRKSNVAAGEAGGITQHIGAYTIAFPHPERKNELAQITFLDTPGHAAFSSMRARGANVTDLVVLVVAANDGVMPQTLEALSHARAAKVPILVAINKIDHPNANSLRVRQQLQDKGLVPDDWGGDTIFAEVSALTKQGVDKLIEMILLQADLLELKANPNRRAKGNVIESGLEPGGPTATVLVRKGTLRVSDVIICGQYYGRVRALINEEAKRLKEAGPSVAVKVLGLNGVPEAGLEFSVVEDEKAARELAGQRAMEAKALGQEARAKVTLETLFDQLASSSSKALKVVVKADTQGSVEAIVEALKKIESKKVALEIIHSAVGTITESDVALASASHAVILGFHTRVDSGVADKAKHEGVQIKLYAIIYELIDQVKEGMAGLLEPDLKDVTVGVAEVRKIFELSKGAPVAGCMVTSGRIVKGKVRIRRRKEIIYEGITQSLRRFQDEVNEVRAGMECGIRIEGFTQFLVGDNIECYTVEKSAQKL